MGGRVLDLVPARRGHFAFGGAHGDLWLDLDALVARPAALRPYTDELAALLAPYRPEVVCGPLTGGAYVAQLVALALEVEFTWSTPAEVARRDALAGRRVAIVDDAINAGAAVTATAAALLGVVPTAGVAATARALTAASAPPATDLRAAGPPGSGAAGRVADLVAVGALLTLGAAPSTIAGAPVLGLAAVPSHLWPAATCPLCAAGTPLA